MFMENNITNGVVLTTKEAASIYELIDVYLLEILRKDEEIDSLDWLTLVLSVRKKCEKSYQEVHNIDSNKTSTTYKF